MTADADQPSVDDLNKALRLLRRLTLRVFIIVIGGIMLDILLVKIGTWLSPPYGVYVFGEGLGEWGMILVVAALIAELWIDGRAMGKILNDPILKSMPVVGALSAPTAIAQRANALGMEWTGFFGPLRPKKGR